MRAQTDSLGEGEEDEERGQGDRDPGEEARDLRIKCVSSQHSASQDTLRDSTKCRGILACARFTALSHTESDEASSRSCCAQLTI